MADVLIIGSGPLPESGEALIGAPAFRTWQTVASLLDTPHTIHLAALPAPGIAPAQESRLRAHEGLQYTLLADGSVEHALPVLQEMLERIKPSCLIAVGSYPAHLAAQLRCRLPLWADFSGNVVAERQINARRIGGDDGLEAAWEREESALLRADKFSTVSMPHLYALLGELGAMGRLNRLTAQYHFVHHVPYAPHPMFTRPPVAKQPALRRVEAPGDAFLVLWSGSFDSWADVETLFDGLEGAMARNNAIHFVSTGAEVAGQDELTYRRFRQKIEKSAHASRYHLLGWVDIGRLPGIMRECDLGLNVDGKHYETIFGARSRLVNMMAAGLPVASTLGAEFSHVLEEESIGLTFPAGDPEALAELLAKYSTQPHALRTMGQKGRNYVTRFFAPPALAQSLREWVDEPRLAPDNLEKDRKMAPHECFQEVPINSIQQTRLRLAGVDLKEMFQSQIELSALRAKWWFKASRNVKKRTLRFLRKKDFIH